MNLAKINEGMTVKVNIKGRIFNAKVEKKHPHYLDITPLQKNITYFRATAREVKGIVRES